MRALRWPDGGFERRTELRRLDGARERVMPGGRQLPVRAFRAVGGTPLVLRSGSGAEFEDVDGRRLCGLRLLVGPTHPRTCASCGAARDHRDRGARHQLWRAMRGGGRTGRVSDGQLSRIGPGAVRLVGHRGDDERDPRGARRHGARPHREICWLLSRTRRSPAGVGRVRPRHLRESVVGGRPRRLRARDHRPAARRRATAHRSPARDGDRIAAVIEPVPANNGCCCSVRSSGDAAP